MKTKTVRKRKAPTTPSEFYAQGAQLDRELLIVRPFERRRGFVFKARTWEELANFEAERLVKENRKPS